MCDVVDDDRGTYETSIPAARIVRRISLVPGIRAPMRQKEPMRRPVD